MRRTVSHGSDPSRPRRRIERSSRSRRHHRGLATRHHLDSSQLRRTGSVLLPTAVLADPRSWHPRSGALNAADYRDADLGQKLPMSVPTRTTPIELVGSGMGSLSAAQVADQLPAMLGGLLDGTIATEFDPTPFDLLSTNRSRPQPRS